MSRCLFTRAGAFAADGPDADAPPSPPRGVRPVRPVVRTSPPQPVPVLASPPRAPGPTLTFPVSGSTRTPMPLRRALGCPPPPWGASPQSPRAPRRSPRRRSASPTARTRRGTRPPSSPLVAARIIATPPSSNVWSQTEGRPNIALASGASVATRYPGHGRARGYGGWPGGAPRGWLGTPGAAEAPRRRTCARRRGAERARCARRRASRCGAGRAARKRERKERKKQNKRDERSTSDAIFRVEVDSKRFRRHARPFFRARARATAKRSARGKLWRVVRLFAALGRGGAALAGCGQVVISSGRGAACGARLRHRGAASPSPHWRRERDTGRFASQRATPKTSGPDPAARLI